MTGYGLGKSENEAYSATVEIKSLNSKNADLTVRLPKNFFQEEIRIKNKLVNLLERGKITVQIVLEKVHTENKVPIKLNKELLISYFHELNLIRTELGIEKEVTLETLLQIDEIKSSQFELGEIDELEIQALDQALEIAIQSILETRKQEGDALQEDLLKNLTTIETLLAEIPQFEIERIDTIKNRIKSQINELKEHVNFDPNRIEQELFFYLEKLDINEEKVRLKQHLDYFHEIMESSSNGGRKLGFIAQEIGREINTIGSKASHSAIQKIVVQMKDSLEQIKEQLMNIL